MLNDVQQKQTRASDPDYSIWTNASAGSGKTTVLVKRLLRMFLAGVEPAKILCITFTNTGAAEMRNRINAKLAEWVALGDDELEREIFLLEGSREGMNGKVKVARSLFAKILDYSNDFKVLTIHSFCQQVIKRFPLEANIIPNFKIADEVVSSELLMKAKDAILKIDNEEIKDAIKYVFTYKNEDDFLDILKQAIGQKDNLLYLKSRFFSVYGVLNEVRKIFKVENDESIEKLEDEFCNCLNCGIFTQDMCENIRAIGKKSDLNFISGVEVFLRSRATMNEYVSVFLTQTGTIRKTIITKNVCEKFPEVLDFVNVEAQRVFDFYEKRNNFLNYEFTAAFLKIVYCVFDIYGALKKEGGYLDYSDLIFETSKLLNDAKFRNLHGENIYSSWINYKLDEGLNHLLIDEAQDTSPIQWDIVRSITEEFFSGYGQHGEENRTIFVVGDEKQSIFSFQGAEPANFNLMLNYYRNKIESCGRKFENIYLETSFRSLKSVLNLADEIFKEPLRRQSISKLANEIKHNVVRNECLGRVEIWPLIEVEKEKDDTAKNEKGKAEDWQINYLENIELTNKQKLAEVIASEVAEWFANGKVIYSRKDKCLRPIKYSDVMILVKNRDKDFINYLIRQFNRNKIPTMGNDKFDLLDSIISQDIISLCKFLLFNEDNLSLANIIKSPFLNLSEEDLYLLCEYKNDNNCTLWKAMQSIEKFENSTLFLNDLLVKEKELSVYELLFYIFENKKMRKNFKERFPYISDEVIDEFLNISNEYDKTHNNSTLLSFINFLENTDLSIKRDMEQESNEVRIITIHSSKGLESPIVILPDTNHSTSIIQKIDTILNSKEEGNDYTIPILQKEKSNIIEKIKMQMKTETEEEYLRLLYVAITRAENELYVFDYKRKGEPKENSWYNILRQAVESKGAKRRKTNFVNEDILYIGDDIEFGAKCNFKETIFENKDNTQVDEVIRILSTNKQKTDEIKIINPSSYYVENVLKKPSENSYNLENGKLVHKLLELLPNANKTEWNDIMNVYLKNKDNANDIKNIVLNVLNNENFSFLFSENSKAEVPIFGKINENIISGQIDRLVVLENIVYIVDYKNTNFLPTEVPQKYVKQLKLYKELLAKIYVNKKIESYILWTSFGKIEKV